MSSILSDSAHRALVWTPTAVTTLVVGLRVYLRSSLRSMHTEDHLIVLAWGLFLVAASLVEANIDDNGTSIYDMVQIDTRGIYTSVCCAVSLTCAKISVALLVLHLMGPTSRWRKHLIITSMVVLVIMTVIFLPMDFLDSCDYTDPDLVSNSLCVDPTTQTGIIQAWNFYAAFVDIAYSIIPITFMYRLQMSLRRKALITLTLSLGWTASIFTVLRAISGYIWGDDSDSAYLVHLLANYLEPTLVIICGSLASLMPLSEVRPFSGSWRSRGRTSYQPAQQRSRSQQQTPDMQMQKDSVITRVGLTPSDSASGEQLMPAIWVERQFSINYSEPSDRDETRPEAIV